MSMLTENPHSLPAVTQAMGTVVINDDYVGPSTFHQHDYAGPSTFHDEYSDPEADTSLNNDPVDSEPDEVENDEEGQNDNDPDDDEVSIPVMLDVLENNCNESSSHVQQGIDLNIPASSGPPSLFSVILFFCTTHPEVPIDSYDIPSSSWGHFYDSNSGELECGMIFKTKAHLIANVQDFSVKFARREYRVVESKPKLWKVVCKCDEATGCNWMLRGIFKAKMGYLKLPNPAYNIKYVQQNVKNSFGSDISYHKKWNPGIVVEWLHLDTDRPDLKMLNYVFWAFRPYLEGFRYCCKLISIDRTHLYTKYKHKLLVAVTLDANQQILPIAFTLVDEESLASWRWFLEMLAKHLMLDDDDRICLIFDRHSGLISAINCVPAFMFSRGVHHFCLRHVCSNFNNKYKNIQLKDLCCRVGAEQNVRKFERKMEEIRELNEEAFDWLQKIDKAQWTLSHDGGWRTGILTTNMSECINGVLKGSRRLPIMAIVRITLDRTVHYFLDRTKKCDRMMRDNQQWADYAFRLFESR
ncbi:UNVERIFIED_CONTAM: hypothetical protein Slati_0949900 [Sesamum latifolium]|uniref:MULE transposase domain-containing protein n=1 Tax=Sesamum latifolium TaxID=2727402 RepID=A0AAW2XT49_9LAMI